MSKVLPFPLTRRLIFIDRHARRAASLNQAARETHIARQIEIQRDAMLRKGIDEELICRELSGLERAIRVALRFQTIGEVV